MDVLASPAIAAAQGGTSSTISGDVMDNTGAVMPGADVAAKHKATGVVQEAIPTPKARSRSRASVPGTYTVTVTLTGFKTVVIRTSS